MRLRLGPQSNRLALVDELCKESIGNKAKAMLYTLSNDSIPDQIALPCGAAKSRFRASFLTRHIIPNLSFLMYQMLALAR